MKKIILSLFTVSTFFLISCSKKDNEKPKADNVKINNIIYPTVVIGSQTWTSVNYNGPGGENLNNSGTNDPTYGKYYTLDEAKKIALPSGWRVPSKEDAEKLLKYLGATGISNLGVYADSTVAIKLKSKTGWKYSQGNNSSGFNALPLGNAFPNYNAPGNLYEGLGTFAVFWTTTYDDSDYAKVQSTLQLLNQEGGDDSEIYNSASISGIPTNFVNTARCNIRFVKDN